MAEGGDSGNSIRSLVEDEESERILLTAGTGSMSCSVATTICADDGAKEARRVAKRGSKASPQEARRAIVVGSSQDTEAFVGSREARRATTVR